MTLINCVQLNLAKFFSFAVQSCSECYVSINRIQTFLELPELKKDVIEGHKEICDGDVAISLKDVT